MRQQFVSGNLREYAEDECPWAAVVVEVDGGFWCFESMADAIQFEAQL